MIRCLQTKSCRTTKPVLLFSTLTRGIQWRSSSGQGIEGYNEADTNWDQKELQLNGDRIGADTESALAAEEPRTSADVQLITERMAQITRMLQPEDMKQRSRWENEALLYVLRSMERGAPEWNLQMEDVINMITREARQRTEAMEIAAANDRATRKRVTSSKRLFRVEKRAIERQSTQRWNIDARAPIHRPRQVELNTEGGDLQKRWRSKLVAESAIITAALQGTRYEVTGVDLNSQGDFGKVSTRSKAWKRIRAERAAYAAGAEAGFFKPLKGLESLAAFKTLEQEDGGTSGVHKSKELFHGHGRPWQLSGQSAGGKYRGSASDILAVKQDPKLAETDEINVEEFSGDQTQLNDSEPLSNYLASGIPDSSIHRKYLSTSSALKVSRQQSLRRQKALAVEEAHVAFEPASQSDSLEQLPQTTEIPDSKYSTATRRLTTTPTLKDTGKRGRRMVLRAEKEKIQAALKGTAFEIDRNLLVKDTNGRIIGSSNLIFWPGREPERRAYKAAIEAGIVKDDSWLKARKELDARREAIAAEKRKIQAALQGTQFEVNPELLLRAPGNVVPGRCVLIQWEAMREERNAYEAAIRAGVISDDIWMEKRVAHISRPTTRSATREEFGITEVDEQSSALLTPLKDEESPLPGHHRSQHDPVLDSILGDSLTSNGVTKTKRKTFEQVERRKVQDAVKETPVQAGWFKMAGDDDGKVGGCTAGWISKKADRGAYAATIRAGAVSDVVRVQQRERDRSKTMAHGDTAEPSRLPEIDDWSSGVQPSSPHLGSDSQIQTRVTRQSSELFDVIQELRYRIESFWRSEKDMIQGALEGTPFEVDRRAIRRDLKNRPSGRWMRKGGLIAWDTIRVDREAYNGAFRAGVVKEEHRAELEKIKIKRRRLVTIYKDAKAQQRKDTILPTETNQSSVLQHKSALMATERHGSVSQSVQSNSVVTDDDSLAVRSSTDVEKNQRRNIMKRSRKHSSPQESAPQNEAAKVQQLLGLIEAYKTSTATGNAAHAGSLLELVDKALNVTSSQDAGRRNDKQAQTKADSGVTVPQLKGSPPEAAKFSISPRWSSRHKSRGFFKGAISRTETPSTLSSVSVSPFSSLPSPQFCLIAAERQKKAFKILTKGTSVPPEQHLWTNVPLMQVIKKPSVRLQPKPWTFFSSRVKPGINSRALASLLKPTSSVEQKSERGYSTWAQTQATEGRPIPILSRPLPISPLMDPSFITAKQKHRAPKARPSKLSMPDKQKSSISKNIYAQALATPLRECKVTRIFLPRFFLQKFNAVKSPVDGLPWLIPRDLSSKWMFGDSNYREASLSTGKTTTNSKTEDKSWDFSDAAELTAHEINTITLPRTTPSIGISHWTFRSYALIDSLGNPRLIKRRRARKIKQAQRPSDNPVPIVFLMNPKFDANTSMKWRPDMADKMLAMMRREVWCTLKHLVGLKRGYVQIGGVTKQSPGAVLWFGDGKPTPPENVGVIPLYDMRKLLGGVYIEALRKDVPIIFDADMAGLRRKTATTALLSRLWQLDMYLASRKASGEMPFHSNLYPLDHTEDVEEEEEE